MSVLWKHVFILHMYSNYCLTHLYKISDILNKPCGSYAVFCLWCNWCYIISPQVVAGQPPPLRACWSTPSMALWSLTPTTLTWTWRRPAYVSSCGSRSGRRPSSWHSGSTRKPSSRKCWKRCHTIRVSEIISFDFTTSKTDQWYGLFVLQSRSFAALFLTSTWRSCSALWRRVWRSRVTCSSTWRGHRACSCCTDRSWRTGLIPVPYYCYIISI